MFDVIIAGGGPVGLFLACELKLAGRTPVVVERLSGPNPVDKAHGLTGQVVRLLDHRGLLERCGGTAPPVQASEFSFGAMHLPLSELGADNPMYLLPINQRDLERVLNERATELGIEIRRGCQLRSFTQAPDHVDVVIAVDGRIEHLSGRFVVGCDGARSGIRKALGIAFTGTTDDRIVDRSMLIAPTPQFRPAPGRRVHVEGLGEIPQFHRTEKGVATIAILDPAHPIVHTTEWEDDPAGDFPGSGETMTVCEMEDSLQRVLGVAVSIAAPTDGSPTLLRRLCGRNTRVADRYRDHRVFIAGDAAHVHAAAGGPGLNLALQDASNLAWKLAAELHGWAPQNLLDTYETERHALGQRVFMQTQAQTALMAPGGDVTALRLLFSELITRRDTLQTIADLMAGSDVRYDMGHDPTAWTGRFAPQIDVVTTDGDRLRLAELCRDAKPLLLVAAEDTELLTTAAPWSDRVRRITAASTTPHTPALLVRPDGYIAWAGSDGEGLTVSLTRWFGNAR